MLAVNRAVKSSAVCRCAASDGETSGETASCTLEVFLQHFSTSVVLSSEAAVGEKNASCLSPALGSLSVGPVISPCLSFAGGTTRGVGPAGPSRAIPPPGRREYSSMAHSGSGYELDQENFVLG